MFHHHALWLSYIRHISYIRLRMWHSVALGGASVALAVVLRGVGAVGPPVGGCGGSSVATLFPKYWDTGHVIDDVSDVFGVVGRPFSSAASSQPGRDHVDHCPTD